MTAEDGLDNDDPRVAMQAKNDHINYIEFKAPDLERIKAFYSEVFGWVFTDYGPDYIAIAESGLDGGFMRSDAPVLNGVLVVLYHKDLKSVLAKISPAGGRIAKEMFPFPGGKRFHFLDPAGNELAVWSEE
jgi:predicted enzyme related to lactoylglutathione lyase